MFTNLVTFDFGGFGFSLTEATMHMLVCGIFASLISPFGGVFAASLKKKVSKITDDQIPIYGPGGITDRFDCAILMTMFVFLYVKHVVFSLSGTLGGIMGHLHDLDTEQ